MKSMNLFKKFHDKEKELDELERKIAEYAEKYYTDGSSPISDDEFDELVETLRKNRPNSKVLCTGWGYCISKTSNKNLKVSHRYAKVGSLDKVRSYSELPKSFKNTQNLIVDASLKLDGLSVVLYYENSSLVQAVTRGDGEVGIDVTDKIVKLIPDKISLKDFTGAIRGEILMTNSSFIEYKKVKPEARNPRNSAAGIMNAKDSIDELKYLSLYVYTIIGSENQTFSDIKSIRSTLKHTFINVVPYITITMNGDLCDVMNELKNKWDREYSDIPSDGIVLTMRNIITDEHNIEYDACAYKFKSQLKSSNVIEVHWELSKHNRLIPKVQIEPIDLDGSTIQFCTGYNAKYIKHNNIGLDSVVTVEKRGEIIPNIQEVLESTEAELPSNCPCCQNRLKWDGVHLVCDNRQCDNQIIQDTLIWIESLAPIENFKDKLMERAYQILLENKIINSLSIDHIMKCEYKNIFNLFPRRQVVSRLFNEQWNLLHSDSKIDTKTALIALNIPRLGELTANKLAPITKEIYYAIIQNKDYLSVCDKIEKLVGQATLNSLLENKDKVTKLKYIIDRIELPITNTLSHKGTVCITGKLSVKREVFKKQLKENGFTISNSVTKNTDYLITDDPWSTSSKSRNAEKYNVMKISEKAFREEFNI